MKIIYSKFTLSKQQNLEIFFKNVLSRQPTTHFMLILIGLDGKLRLQNVKTFLLDFRHSRIFLKMF